MIVDALDALNPEQRAAVLHASGPLLILAGAGSGKTRVIAYRIAHLVGGGFAEPHEVLAVTFTNKAAEEMRARVEALLGGAYKGLWILTFHALCARLLRREATHIGLSRDFVIYDSSDQLSAVKQVLKTLQVEESFIQPRAALSAISRAKNSLVSPEALAAKGHGYRDDLLAKIYLAYTKLLGESCALDFDDLLVKTVELFEKSEAVRQQYAERFRYVMVDEYQDTNRPQYLLMRRLAAVHRNLTVVGDPDQSIYAWRGADIRNILDFEQDFGDTTVVKLEQNYRSTEVILGAASAVISNNRQRKEKTLWTARKGGDLVVYGRCGDELEEADFVARTARGAVGDNTEDTVAILYRTNAQSRVIEDAMRRENLLYKIIGNVRFYERKEVKDALAYLRLLLNPHDSVSVRRVINVPARGIGKGVMDALDAVLGDGEVMGRTAAAAEERQSFPPQSLWTALVRGLDARRFNNRAAASLAAFRDLVRSLTEVSHAENVSTTIAKVLDQAGYLQDLRSEQSEEAEGRIENLAELVSAAREYEMRESDASLSGFVDRLSLLSETDETKGSENARILLMTLHAAKGLEFPAVIITGLEEGLFPHMRADSDDNDLEEERRLCYVGMTRARGKLFLTSANRRRVFGEYRSCEPSRFIDEVPASLVQRYDFVGYGSSGYGGGSGAGRQRDGSGYGRQRDGGALGAPSFGRAQGALSGGERGGSSLASSGRGYGGGGAGGYTGARGRQGAMPTRGSSAERGHDEAPWATSGGQGGGLESPGSPGPRSPGAEATSPADKFRVKESASYSYEDEDQAAHTSGLKLGMRVRHPQFGTGQVIGVEDYNDDVKVTVRFTSVGVKRLLAKYAKLQRA